MFFMRNTHEKFDQIIPRTFRKVHTSFISNIVISYVMRHFTLIIIKIPPEGAIIESVDNASKESELVKNKRQSLPQRRYRSNSVIPPPQATVASLIYKRERKEERTATYASSYSPSNF